MNELNTIPSTLPSAMTMPVVHSGNPMDGPFRALRACGLGGGFVALAAVIALLYYGRLFLMTVCAAVIINFILEPFVGLLVRVHAPRALASLIVCSLALCAVYFAGLGVYTHATRLVEDVPRYAQRIGDLSDRVLTKVENIEQAVGVPKRLRESGQAQQPQAVQPTPPGKRRHTPEPSAPAAPTPGVQEVRIRPERTPLEELIYSHLGSLYDTLLTASSVPFLVFFMLSWRDHVEPAFLQLFEGPGRIVAATSLQGIASMLRAFVVGNFLLGLVLTAASTAFFWWFPLPYPMLIGPLSGFLSLVPSLGMPLSLIPPLLAALAVYTSPVPYLIIAGVLALFHFLAMNLLYPKIVGPRVHLNPLVVTAALMFWSVLWGGAGLILAIPLTAGIKAVCDNVKSLECYGRLLGD